MTCNPAWSEIPKELIPGQNLAYRHDLTARVFKGPTTCLDLKTVDGHELETFRQACEKLGLLEDDNPWNATMEDSVLCRSP
ncbi:ATP-dependent DNA helicase [Trichonephila clavipes]|nr:ATP-dependent DNA helicase [Trichonephila clavipes]